MAFGKTTAYHKIKALKKPLRVVQGGTSAGKTIAILLLLLEYATKHPNKIITIASINMPHLKRGALRDFRNILTANSYWQYYQIKENKSDSTFTFYNGTVIEFIALDEGKARGSRRDVLFLNEANLVNFDTFDQLEVRTRDFAILDYNPTAEFWAHTELVAKRDDVDFIICTYKDNEALDDSIVAKIEARKSNENWWRVYGEGQIGELEGLVYSGWQAIDSVPETAELIGYGLDFGFTNDPTALVAVYKHADGFLLDERLYRQGMFNKDIAAVIQEEGLSNYLGVADSASPKDIAELVELGCTIRGAVKTSGDTKLSYRQWSVNKVIEEKIYYTKSSTNLQREYLGYMWQTDRTGKSLNVPQDGNDHLLDAARYKIVDTTSVKPLTYSSVY